VTFSLDGKNSQLLRFYPIALRGYKCRFCPLFFKHHIMESY
jgi:hypothetical protein